MGEARAKVTFERGCKSKNLCPPGLLLPGEGFTRAPNVPLADLWAALDLHALHAVLSILWG